MRLPSSSISSFEGSAMLQPQMLGHRKFRRRVLAILLSTILCLVGLDLAVGLIFRPPADPRGVPAPLQAYFDYGRSIESKLRRMVGVDSEHDALIVNAGWLAHDCDRSVSFPADKLGIEVYGNSFSLAIAEQIEILDPRFAIQHFGGPGASPNHSFACFVQRNESGQARAPIQIIGVLGSSLRRMLTISGLTTSFEQPQPFTYPRYTLGTEGHLIAHRASIQSPDELRSALADPVQWGTFVDELATMDAFYTPEMMSANLTDNSVLLRMVRRAWGQRVLRDRTAALHAEMGFDGSPELAPVLRAILIDFANRARAAGQRPLVILIEDRGYGGLLSAILARTLRESKIEFIATGEIASSDDPHNFVPDGHFTPAVFAEIGRATLRVLNRTP
jgi:hypothetical protein